LRRPQKSKISDGLRESYALANAGDGPSARPLSKYRKIEDLPYLAKSKISLSPARPRLGPPQPLALLGFASLTTVVREIEDLS